MKVAWAESVGINWGNAPDDVKEQFALVRLFWFFHMVKVGGPDSSDLDAEVLREAQEAADWIHPRLNAAVRAARIERANDYQRRPA